MKNSVIFLCMFFVISVFSQTDKTITKHNIGEKIIDAYTKYELYDDESMLTDVLDYTSIKNIKIKDNFIHRRLLFLKCVQEMNAYSGIVFESKKILHTIIEMSEKAQDKELLGAAYQLLGVSEMNLENDNIGVSYSRKAIAYFEDINAKNQQIDTYYNIAYSLSRLEKWEEAIISAKKAIALITNLNVKKSRLKYLHIKIAFCQTHLGNYLDTKKHLKIAKKLTSKKNISTYALIHMAYAELYGKLGEYKKSNEAYVITLKNKKKIQIKKDVKLRNIVTKEFELKNKLNINKDKLIKNQKFLLIIGFSFLAIMLFFLWRVLKLSRTLKQSLSQIKFLNKRLETSVEDIKSTNLNLKNKNNEVNYLLQLNERTLFSKVLKISTYNDTIVKLINDVSSLIEKNEVIKPNNLFKLEKSLKLLINENDLWQDFKIQYEKTKPDFFKKIKKISPDITVNELKHCAYIVSKLRTKDVANLINVSPRSVETARYRIKKKLMVIDESLFSFLQKI